MAVVELGLWSILLTAAVVKRFVLSFGGHTTCSCSKHYLQGLQTTEVLYHMKYTDLGERVCRQGLFFVYVHAKAGQGK